MDPVTHALTGLCIARSLPRTERGRDTDILVVAASLLPDIDVTWALWEPETAALTRHLLTHSLTGLAALSVGFGALAWLLFRRLSLSVYFMLVGLAVLAHLGLDVINAFGVAVLYPWSSYRFELPLAFILDPVLTGILLIGVLVPSFLRDQSAVPLASRAALLLAFCYLASAFSLRLVANDMLLAHAGADGGAHGTYLVPEPGSPLQWKGIYSDGEGYQQVLVYPLSGRIVELSPVPSTPGDLRVAAVRRTVTGQLIDGFLKTPVWHAEGKTVVAYDLRFRFAALDNDWDPFSFCFRDRGSGPALVPQDLDVYLANWRKALVKFGILPSPEAVLTACPAERIGVARVHSLG